MEEKFNGKKLKVNTNQLSFGKSSREVYVFGVYKKGTSNKNYIIYSDVENNHNIIYFADAHLKPDNSILTLDAKDSIDIENVKEIIFKITNNEDISDYEISNIEEVEFIEIIGYSSMELKPEIISSLIDKTIPKNNVIIENKPTNKEKRNKSIIPVLILVLILVGGYVVYNYFIKNKNDTNGAIDKTILCERQYKHEELNVLVTEDKTFNFNNQDELISVDANVKYNFKNEDDYLEFVNKGLYYKYMPNNVENGGYSLDDNNLSYMYSLKEVIGEGYKLPTSYEDVLSYYKKSKYNCNESVNK